MGILCWLEGWGENRIQPFCISSSVPNTSLGKKKNPGARFGTLGCLFFCLYPLLSVGKLWALTAECIFLHVQWYVLIASFYSLLSNVKEFICQVCRAGLALTSCLFWVLGRLLVQHLPNLCWRKVLETSPLWNVISNAHTHTVPGLVLHKTCPGNWLQCVPWPHCQSCRGTGAGLAEGVFWSQEGILLGHSSAEAMLCGILTLLWLLKWFSHFWVVHKDMYLGKTLHAREVVQSTGWLCWGCSSLQQCKVNTIFLPVYGFIRLSECPCSHQALDMAL